MISEKKRRGENVKGVVRGISKAVGRGRDGLNFKKTRGRDLVRYMPEKPYI